MSETTAGTTPGTAAEGQKWTAEPWASLSWHNKAEATVFNPINGRIIADCPNAEDAHRIALCINSCTGISNADLARGVVPAPSVLSAPAPSADEEARGE